MRGSALALLALGLLASTTAMAGEFDFEINNNSMRVVRETVQLNAQGWANFNKVYPVYSPNVGVVIYHAPANTKVKMTIYAGH